MTQRLPGLCARPVTMLRRVVVGLLVVLVVVLASAPGAAFAHATLVGASPVQNSVLASAPAEVRLVFSEPVNPVAGKVQVIGPDGRRVDAGEASTAGGIVRIALRPDGPRGTYLVSYRVISADNHPVAGAYPYSIGAPSAGGPPASAQAGSGPVVTVGLALARWVGYAGLVLLVGSVLVLMLLWPGRLERRWPMRASWLGAGVIAAASLAEVGLQIPYATGSGPGDVRATDVREVLASPYGAAHLVRLGVLAVVLVVSRPIVRGRGWASDRVVLAILGAIGVATWPVSGHPGATPVPILTVAADMIHLASMSVWLGGLVMLAVFLLPRANAVELAAIVPVWSRWAAYAVVVLVLTGTVQAVVEVGTVDALVATTYGRIVLGKLGLVAAVVAVAWLSRRQVASVANGHPGAAGRLRGLVAVEAGVAALVLTATTVLVQTPPGRSATAAAAPSVQVVTVRGDLFVLTMDVVPARTGLNDVHLYASTPAGLPADVKQWRVRARLPAAGIEPIDAATLALTPDHATGQISLPQAGRWTFTVTVRLSEVDQSTLTADLTIAP